MNTKVIQLELKATEKYLCKVLGRYWNFEGGVKAYVQGVGDKSESLIEALNLADRTFPSPKEANQRKQLRDALTQYRKDYGFVVLSNALNPNVKKPVNIL